jgi:7-keto-8-aminopelargonate synthetase-like enzyme
VPEGTARLRLSLRVGVTTDQLSAFAIALTRLRQRAFDPTFLSA